MNLQGTGLDLSTQVGSKCQGGTASLLDFGHYSSALQDREPIGLEFPGLHNRLHLRNTTKMGTVKLDTQPMQVGHSTHAYIPSMTPRLQYSLAPRLQYSLAPTRTRLASRRTQ